MSVTDTETVVKKIKGYDSDGMQCTIFVYGGWYAIEGSTEVKQVYEDCQSELVDRVELDMLLGGDKDKFTASTEIDSTFTLETEVDNYLN